MGDFSNMKMPENMDMEKMKDFDFSNMKMPENMDMGKMKDMAKDFGVDENLFDNINMDDVQNAMKNGNFNMDDMKKQYDQYFTKKKAKSNCNHHHINERKKCFEIYLKNISIF